jgi:hypothetical protein
MATDFGCGRSSLRAEASLDDSKEGSHGHGPLLYFDDNDGRHRPLPGKWMLGLLPIIHLWPFSDCKTVDA